MESFFEPEVRDPNETKRFIRKVAIWVVVVGVVVALFAIPVTRHHILLATGWRIEFDSHAWKNAPVSADFLDPTRKRMVADLFRNYELVGMSRKDVMDLLGDERADEFPTDDTAFYYMGVQTFLSVEHPKRLGVYLEVDLEDSKVVSAAVRRQTQSIE